MLQEYAASARTFAMPVRMNVLSLTVNTASNVKKNAGHVQNHVLTWLLNGFSQPREIFSRGSLNFGERLNNS
jgi:hypothetical protein